MQVIQTYSYRIKDSSSRKHLCRMAGAVNFVWNYCNEVASEMWGRQRHWATAFDLNNLTSGAAKELPINSQTIQAIAKECVTRRNQFHKRKLRWRSKKNLGWIPFNGQTVALVGDTIKYRGMTCSHCLERTGPRGVRNLGIRDWRCTNCGISHDRDVNAAKNILSFGMVGRPETGCLPLPSGLAAGAGGSKKKQPRFFPLGHERPN